MPWCRAMASNVFVTEMTEEYWELFQHLRLEALQAYPQFYSLSYQEEVGYNREQVQQKWLSGGDKCMFCLRKGGMFLGIAGVFTWEGDSSGKTGVLGAAYIRLAYQGLGYSKLLYRARIEWALGHKEWNKLVVSHRASNERSRRANQASGFKFTHKTAHSWPDGTEEDEWHYELDLEALRAPS